MRKNTIILLSLILICGLFSGCSKATMKNGLNENSSNELITELKQENKKFIEENKKLTEQLANAKKEVESTRKGNSLRLELERKFHDILRLMKKEKVEELKALVTDNIVVEKGKIINQHGYKKEFIVPKKDTYYIPRYCSAVEENGEKRFNVAYEFFTDYDSEYKSSKQVLYVTFKQLEQEWKLDVMEIDIN